MSFNFSGLPLRHIAVLNLARDQDQSGWTISNVRDLRLELKIVTIMDGEYIVVIMMMIYLLAAFQVRNIFSFQIEAHKK